MKSSLVYTDFKFISHKAKQNKHRIDEPARQYCEMRVSNDNHPPRIKQTPPPKLVVSNHTGTFTINKLLKKTGSLLLQKHCQYTFHNFLSVFTDNPGKKFVDFLNFDTIPPSPPFTMLMIRLKPMQIGIICNNIVWGGGGGGEGGVKSN